jgi:hypothetical protein
MKDLMRQIRIILTGWIVAVCCLVLTGCDGSGRMDHPEDPQGRYSQQISVARTVLDRKTDWGSRAEWEVVKTSSGWKVTAWRIEHPNEKGAKRYVPWGYAIIEMDNNMSPQYYRAGK